MEKNYDPFKGQSRLPKFAVPKRYDLKLKPDLVTCKFAGAVDISLDVVSPTKFIVLNAAELSVDPKTVHFKSSNKVKIDPLLNKLEKKWFDKKNKTN